MLWLSYCIPILPEPESQQTIVKSLWNDTQDTWPNLYSLKAKLPNTEETYVNFWIPRE